MALQIEWLKFAEEAELYWYSITDYETMHPAWLQSS